jgi:hypothetical protein
MGEVIYVSLNGVTYSAIQCGNCYHTTPAGGVCVVCQPFPEKRCITCFLRDSVPATITIAPGQINDPPGGPTPMTIVATPSGMNQPPGHNS